MLAWIRSLFGRSRGAAAPRALPSARPAAEHPRQSTAPRAALPARKGLVLDHEPALRGLHEREQQLLARIGLRVQRRQMELPQLPSTGLGAIDLCARAHVEIGEVVALIERDPVLSSELLRVANSVLYSAREPAHTLGDAIVRVGLRTLRSMLYAISVRGAILGDRSLAAYAEEVWRQANSCGAIARALAGPLRLEAERAYLIGLLHDVGKLPLLAMLRKSVAKESEVTPALVGRMFRNYHEQAGSALASAWRLPEELVAVAGKHHDFAGNSEHAQAAALASLVHKCDLTLSLGSQEEFQALARTPEFEILGVPEARRGQLLAAAEAAFAAQQGEHASR